jgi:hypothetical protein
MFTPIHFLSSRLRGSGHRELSEMLCTVMGLFIGQSKEFFRLLAGLAEDADAAQNNGD